MNEVERKKAEMTREAELFLLMMEKLRAAPMPLGTTSLRGAEFRILYEPHESYLTRCAIVKMSGRDEPPREVAYEVSFWPVVGQPCYTQQGATLAEALEKALEAPFPAKVQ